MRIEILFGIFNLDNYEVFKNIILQNDKVESNLKKQEIVLNNQRVL